MRAPLRRRCALPMTSPLQSSKISTARENVADVGAFGAALRRLWSVSRDFSVVQAVQEPRGLWLQRGAGHRPCEAFRVPSVGIGPDSVELLLLSIAGGRVGRDAVAGRYDRAYVIRLRRERCRRNAQRRMRGWVLDDEIEALHQHARLRTQPLALEGAPERLGFIDGRIGAQAVEGGLLGGAVARRLPLRHRRLRRGRRLRGRRGRPRSPGFPSDAKVAAAISRNSARWRNARPPRWSDWRADEPGDPHRARRAPRARAAARPPSSPSRSARVPSWPLRFFAGRGACRPPLERGARRRRPDGWRERRAIRRATQTVPWCDSPKLRPRRRLQAARRPGSAASPGDGGHARRRRHERRHERDIFAAERAVDVRLLAMVGRAQHVIAHLAERKADIEARLGDVFEERSRERTVASVAVIGDGAGLGRERDQRVRDGRGRRRRAPSRRPA